MKGRWYLLVAAGFAMAASWVLPLSAEEPPAGVKSITAADDYLTVVIEFEGEQLYGNLVDDGNEGFAGSGELLFASTGGPTLSAQDRDGAKYTLTFQSSFIPHETVITVNGGTAYLENGDPVTVPDVATPFAPEDLAALVAGTGDLPAVPSPDQLDLGEGDPNPFELPFIHDWFGQAMQVKDILPGLDDLDTDGKTEAEVVDALTGLADGVISAITFNGRVATFHFDDEKVAHTRTVEGTAGAESIGGLPFDLSLTGDVEVGAGLGGTVDIEVDASTARLAAAEAEVVLTVDGDFDATGRLGVVDVEVQNTTASVDATIALGFTCPDATALPCAVADVQPPSVDVTGEATLDVKTVEVTFPLSTTEVFELDEVGGETPSLLKLVWDLAPPTNVTADVDELAATGLRGFTSISVSDIAGGLQWIATWLLEVEAYGNLAADLPIVGTAAGDLANLAATLSEPTQALGQLLGLIGDLSAQDLLDLCDPDKIGAKIGELNLALEDLESLLGKEGTFSVLLGELKDVAVEVAELCEPLLGGLAYDAGEHLLTYTVSFETTHEIGELLGRSLDLGVTEDFDGISVAVRGGDWSTSSATIELDLTIGVKLDTLEDLEIAEGVVEGDFDGDGVPDDTDTDIDGDGLPERFTFEEGDRCRGLASLFGTSSSKLQAYFGITAPTRDQTGAVVKTVDAECDEKLASGTDLTTSQGGSGLHIGGDETTAKITVLTAEHVCAAAAGRFGLTADELVARNGTADLPGPGDLTRDGPKLTTIEECAAAVAQDGDDGEYNFDDERAMTSRAALPHRFFVEAGDVLSGSLRIEGIGVGAHADLGILDLDVDVTTLLFEPKVALELVDPGETDTLKDDGKIDLWELASKTDAPGGLADLLDLTFEGPFRVNVDLHNEAIMGSHPRGVDVYGDVADLGGGFEFHEQRLTEPPDDLGGKIHIGHDLAEFVNLKDISPAQALRMIVAVLEQLANMADGDIMSTTIPFVDVTPQDMVDFTRSLADVIQRVEERSPEDITALQAALDDALTAAGMPSGLKIHVDADELTLSFDLSRSITRSYPFSFTDDDLPFPFLPADGGASVTATASVTFEPTIGIKFDDRVLEDRIFLRGLAPRFDVEVDASLFGTVQLGPVLGAVRGEAKLGDPERPELAVEFKDADGEPLGDDDDLTLSELADVLADEPADEPENPGARIGLTYGGPFEAEFDVSATLAGIGRVSGTVTIEGDLADLGDIAVEIVGFDDFELQLDLGAFVDGTTAAARFVGRALQKSEALSSDLPFLGDDLAKLAAVGTDLRTVADEIDAFWKELEDPTRTETFVADIEDFLNDNLCDEALDHLGDDCHFTVNLDGSEEPVTIANADAFEIGLHLGWDDTKPLALDAGLDLDVFALDLAMEPELRYGYGLDVVLGLSLTEGFYLKPGGSMDTDFLQLFAGLNVPDLDAGVNLFGLSANIEDGTVKIGGALGPDENAGGFAVGLADGKDKLSIKDLVNRRTKLSDVIAARFDIDIKANLPLTVAVEGIAQLTVPVHFSMEGSDLDLPQPVLLLGCDPDHEGGHYAALCPDAENIGLDVSSIVENVIKPVLGDILGDADINPLGQAWIKEALDAEIPVLDTNVRSIMREAAKAANLESAWLVIEFLVDVGNLHFDCRLAGESGANLDCFTGELNLGWAEILPTFVHHKPPPDEFGNPDWGIPRELWDLIETLQRLSGSVLSGPFSTQGSTEGDGLGVQTTSTQSVGSMLSFPLLDNPGDAIKLLLGGELAEPVTFIEFTPPEIQLGKGINFSQTLFDLDIGFLKGGLTVALKGNIGLFLHVGFGYDSTGLSTGNPLDGFYLVDHAGFEVALGAAVSALVDGHFSVAGDLASVRFKGSGGVSLKAGLDLFDDSIALPRHSRNNGKLHLWEIGVLTEAYGNPLCMFALGVKFDANLSFSGKAKVAGITVFDKSWKGSWVLVDERLTCSPLPVPAHIDDTTRRLVLNAGPYADFRFDGKGDVGEHFTLTPSGDKVKVELTTKTLATGVEPATISKEYDLADFDEIYGELGAGPNSVDIDDAITVPATLIGGPQDDELKGGGGDDFIDGGGGDNTLSGGPGDDLIRGGDGDDVIDGGPGDDILEGGAGTNTYVFDDRWGDDTMEDAGANAILDFTNVENALVGRVAFDEATMRSTYDGPAEVATLSYFADEVMVLLGGEGDDDVELNRYFPDGFRIDLGEGSDTVTLKFSGINRIITVEDSGSEDDEDHLVVMGTASDDLFLFRADGPDDSAGDPVPATHGFIALGARDYGAEESELKAALPAAKAEAKALAEAENETFDEEAWEEAWREHFRETQARAHLVAGLVDRVDYDDAFEKITAKGVAGANHFYLDDAAAPMTIDTGDGGNTIQVGQIFRYDRRADAQGPKGRTEPNVAVGDEARTRGTFVAVGEDSDYLTYGISHPTTINGGIGNDLFTVYSNRANLKLNGISGDNVFLLRAFVLDGTVEAAGGDGNDRFEYVQNEKVEIDGGDGFNTLIIVGTPFSDGFILDEGGIDVCPIASSDDPKKHLPVKGDGCGIDVDYVNIQSVVVHGLHGNNVFWVRASDPHTHYQLFGGSDGATFYVHDPVDGVKGVAGPVTVDGEFDPRFDVSLRKPVVLPGEDGTEARGTIPVEYDRSENWLLVDASPHTTDDVGWLTECTGFARGCREDSSRIVGLGMGGYDDDGKPIEGVPIRVATDKTADPPAVMEDFPTGIVYHTIDELTVELGSGDDLFTVHSTHTSENLDGEPTTTETFIQGGPGDDEIHVKRIDGPTTVEGQEGDDTVRVGSVLPDLGGRVNRIGDLLHVDGGEHSADGGDSLWLDDTGNSGDATVTVTEDSIAGLGMAKGITYEALELLDIDLGDHDEVVNVQGTSAVTHVHGNDGDEHFYVSSAADLTPSTRILGDTTASERIATNLLAGHLDAVAADLHLDAGAGRHLLMVSDRATEEDGDATEEDGDDDVKLTAGSITGLAPAHIHYDADGTFADGITVWTSDQADTVLVESTRRDLPLRTITTLNTGGGDDDVTVELDAVDDGFFVANLEDGDDVLRGGESSLGLIVFGGNGADTITTGAGDDVVFGDQGRVEYRDAEDEVVTRLGAGGDGDFTDGAIRPLAALRSVELCAGGDDDDDDVIHLGAGDDVAYGGAGDDVLYGGAGADVLLGDHGQFDEDWAAPQHRSLEHDSNEVCAGNDTLYGGAGNDLLMGQQGDDTLYANASPLPDGDEESPEEMRARIAGIGVPGDNLLIGGHDQAEGLDGDDVLIGGVLGNDTIIGDNGTLDGQGNVVVHDLACDDVGSEVDCDAVAGNDLIRGVGGVNRLYGGVGDDYVVGGAGYDHIEGGPGDDWLEGGEGDDDLIGGSSFKRVSEGGRYGYPSGNDVIFGTAGENVIIADNGRITRSDSGMADAHFASPGRWILDTARWMQLYDLVDDPDPRTGGDDLISAGPGSDLVFAQAGDDWVSGGGGDDHIEAGAGDDVVFADRRFGFDDGSVVVDDEGTLTFAGAPVLDMAAFPAPAVHAGLLELRDADPLGATPWAGVEGAEGPVGQNDVIGGSAAASRPDGDDLVLGGESHDVVVGDNGTITRTAAGDEYEADPAGRGVAREIQVHDLACALAGAECGDVAGDDLIHGRGGHDRLYGGLGEDYLVGGEGDDHLEGGPGDDWLEGGPGDDDLIGGSSFELPGIAGGEAVFPPSGSDVIFGTAGENVILGDNGRITRHAGGAQLPADPYFDTATRWVGLRVDRSVEAFSLEVGGHDVISAGPGESFVFGQGGHDWISGGDGGDYLEGNAGQDVIFGDRQLGLSEIGGTVSAAVAALPTVADRALAPFPGVQERLIDHRSADPLGATPWGDVEGEAAADGAGHGPDDIIGGSALGDIADAADVLYGDGSHDFILGDNGVLRRLIDDGVYELYDKRYLDHQAPDDAIKRRATRHDVGAQLATGFYGNDFLDGGPGNDTLYGQDGDDELWGGDGDDHLFGELGDDRLFGGPGDDVLVGDRGSVVTVFITGNPAIDRIGDEVLALAPMSFNSPPFLSYQPFVAGRLYHRVDLLRDLDETLEGFAPLPPDGGGGGGKGKKNDPPPTGPEPGEAVPFVHNGHDHGGDDLLRGGQGHDVLYGGAGDDLMNGDSGGDVLFGGDGDDALWGGMGNPDDHADRGPQDRFVDYLFGGWGEDLHDYAPRAGIDLQEWLEATQRYWHPDITDRDSDNAEEFEPQHRQGTDWMFGGWDRDVFQGDLTGNGPNEGDRMIDWTGAYNLYTHCNAAYGGQNDLRSSSPAMIDFLEKLAYSLGAGSLEEVTTSGTSGFRNLSMIYSNGNKSNSGKAHDGSPGNFFVGVGDCLGD